MLDPAEAAAAIADKIEANGGEPVQVSAVPKGNGVWLANVSLRGSDDVRQGIFLDSELSET